MMFLAYLNQLLSTYCGAAVVTVCVQVWVCEGGGGGEALPSAVRGWRYAPAVAAPTLFVLGLLATAATTTAKHRVARSLLIVYGVVSVLCSCLALGVAAWGGVELWGWLRGEGAGKELDGDHKLLPWIRPLLPLLAPEHINSRFASEEVRWEVVVALSCGGALPLLLLLAGITALCCRPPQHCQYRGANNTGTSRSNSLHYESTSIYKIPLNDSAVW